jgi:molybdopterin-guanine dinucleotide biosynthesis protein A
MGRDKALLPYRGSTLLNHSLGLLREVTPDVAILCGPERRYEDIGAPLVTDAVCGVGPLGGLYSALLSASIDNLEQIVWLGVDLPLVAPSLLEHLLRELEQADVAMARTTHGIEPLCAAFQTAPTLEAVRRALLDGRLKLTSALATLRVHTIDGDDAHFVNVNSPEEYERVMGPAGPE